MNDPGWFVYILRCADGTFYTGITNDLDRRCRQHNAGTASRYTRCRLPARVVYHEPQATRSLALKREATVKALSRRQKEALVRTPPPVTPPPHRDRSSSRAG
jgi:predicted GIY-YIG superfamily endonuclease